MSDAIHEKLLDSFNGLNQKAEKTGHDWNESKVLFLAR